MSDATNLESMKALFDLASKLNEDALDRIGRIDQKSRHYLTILTFLIGLFSAFVRFGLVDMLPPRGFTDWITILASAGTFFVLIRAWLILYDTQKIMSPHKLQLDVEAFYFDPLPDVYYALSFEMREGIKKNIKLGDTKADLAEKGYRLAKWCMILISVLLLFACIGEWRYPVQTNHHMPDDPTPETQPEPAPREAPRPTNVVKPMIPIREGLETPSMPQFRAANSAPKDEPPPSRKAQEPQANE